MTLPRPMEAPASFDGQRVAVVGLGIEGQDAAMFLRREGAEVTRVDRQPERADRSPDDLSLLEEVQSLVVSQGVPYDLPLLVDAARRSVPVFGPVQIFLERCPANQVIGITGSAGKTTTTMLVHRMLEAAAVPTALGGNIGQGLLQQLPDLSAGTTVVAEISHTQLLRTTRSPHVAAITNITPNHLDQFSWDEYQELKYRIVEYQTSQDRVVLPLDERLAARAMTRTPAAASWFGLSKSPCAATAFSDGEQIVRNDSLLMAVEELLIPGEHNLRNALAALAIVGDLVPDNIAADVLCSFTGVPHRLELVAEVGGVRFVNDSIATTPERTLAGLRAIPGPIVLMLGGRDKKLPLDPLLPELDRHVREVVLFGEAAPAWSRWLSEQRIHHVRLDTFASAFEQAAETAQHGETVLMSPGGTSFDAYPNFEARGQHFRELVGRRLPGRRPDNVG
ncbi:MAG: UDP-N-acetylmuramoyl-L-alanine--D-glutamate ligase [Chloroflexota bacterium]|nr:UDP-N-acetylmuramoyl-L-alanine--D-glutamate ligase [Chloroflexota bacterium]